MPIDTSPVSSTSIYLSHPHSCAYFFFFCFFIFYFFFFFFNDTATTEIYTLSLHDALPIFKNNVNIIMKPTVLDYSGCDVAVVPWINNENYKEYTDFIKNCKDRKSTRLNSSHTVISYAVFCLKKKNKKLSMHKMR